MVSSTTESDPFDTILVMSSSAGTREDLFVEVNQHLVERGFVRATFLEALTKREHDFPTGVDFGHFAIAIPHIDPEHVVQPSALVCRSASPVTFRAMDNPDRELACRLTIWPLVTDPQTQVPLLSSVLRALQKPGVYEQLVELPEDRVQKLMQAALQSERSAV
jgi:PTS system galactitol-specific IIA component